MKTFEEFYEKEISYADEYDSHVDLCYQTAQKAWNAATEAAKPRWIPVTEMLPEKDEKYLIITDNYEGFQTAWFNQSFGLFEVSHLDISSKEVTHWMAVPE